jgi:hypothetical protein
LLEIGAHCVSSCTRGKNLTLVRSSPVAQTEA